MRPELWEPGGGIDSLSAEDLHCVLLLVGHDVPAETVGRWTQFERLLAYDYAMREHLSASDNLNRRRPCPDFVTQAEAS